MTAISRPFTVLASAPEGKDLTLDDRKIGIPGFEHATLSTTIRLMT